MSGRAAICRAKTDCLGFWTRKDDTISKGMNVMICRRNIARCFRLACIVVAVGLAIEVREGRSSERGPTAPRGQSISPEVLLADWLDQDAGGDVDKYFTDNTGALREARIVRNVLDELGKTAQPLYGELARLREAAVAETIHSGGTYTFARGGFGAPGVLPRWRKSGRRLLSPSTTISAAATTPIRKTSATRNTSRNGSILPNGGPGRRCASSNCLPTATRGSRPCCTTRKV